MSLMKNWKLNQTKQCKTCPWRKVTKVKNILGYNPKLHENLQNTIADKPPVEQLFDSSLETVMLCHHSSFLEKLYCIGWVHNQLGTGNNIKLRMQFMSCENGDKIEVLGEQVKSFRDTFQ